MRKLQIPASSANLGPGFDALSLALEMHLTVEIEPGSGVHSVAPSGAGSERIPTGGDNLILRVLERTAERRGRRVPPALLKVHSEIPLGRGLGSSAAAILAGISCYELLAGERLSAGDLFECAYEFETHPDNLAASLYGGLTASASSETGGPVFSRISVAPGAAPVLIIPDFELSTVEARRALPESYSRQDVVFNIQRAAMMAAVFVNGEWALLGEVMRDRVHQPHRARLIPGLEEVLALRPEGLWGAALSGAGPTVLALAAPEKAEAVGNALVRAFNSRGVSASAHVTSVDFEGRRFVS